MFMKIEWICYKAEWTLMKNEFVSWRLKKERERAKCVEERK